LLCPTVFPPRTIRTTLLQWEQELLLDIGVKGLSYDEIVAPTKRLEWAMSTNKRRFNKRLLNNNPSWPLHKKTCVITSWSASTVQQTRQKTFKWPLFVFLYWLMLFDYLTRSSSRRWEKNGALITSFFLLRFDVFVMCSRLCVRLMSKISKNKKYHFFTVVDYEVSPHITVLSTRCPFFVSRFNAVQKKVRYERKKKGRI
jgi:hypothetical protein